MQAWEHISNGFYRVDSERGFDQAFVHFWNRKPHLYEVPRECPAVYPSLVCFTRLTSTDGKVRVDGDHVSVNWVPLQRLESIYKR